MFRHVAIALGLIVLVSHADSIPRKHYSYVLDALNDKDSLVLGALEVCFDGKRIISCNEETNAFEYVDCSDEEDDDIPDLESEQCENQCVCGYELEEGYLIIDVSEGNDCSDSEHMFLTPLDNCFSQFPQSFTFAKGEDIYVEVYESRSCTGTATVATDVEERFCYEQFLPNANVILYLTETILNEQVEDNISDTPADTDSPSEPGNDHPGEPENDSSGEPENDDSGEPSTDTPVEPQDSDGQGGEIGDDQVGNEDGAASAIMTSGILVLTTLLLNV